MGSSAQNFGRRHPGLILAAIAAVFMFATVAPASAMSSGATAWGSDGNGQLGDGFVGSSALPVAVGELADVVAISAGGDLIGDHSLALLSNGTGVAWGDNENGQLGDGERSSGSGVPVAISGLSGATALAAGGHHSLALLGNGTVEGWGGGAGPHGELFFQPAPVSGLSKVTAIAAGGANSLALLTTGTVMEWGNTPSDAPVAVGGLSKVTAIAAGGEHNLALLSNGTVMAWGANGAGQLGDGTTIGSSVPVAVSGLTGVTAVSAGGEHSLALLADGTVMAWGGNGSGQLGDGTTTNSDLPVAVSELGKVTAIVAGGRHSLALLGNATVQAWGANGAGQLGNGTTTSSDVPVAVQGLTGVLGIAAGAEHSLAYGPPVPRVTNVGPDVGPQAGGTTVTITGTDLGGATAVDFGATAATSFSVHSATSITATSPAHPLGMVDVTVTTPEGTSPASPGDRFSYGVPAVTKLKPAHGSAAGGTTVTITGTELAGATEVKFGAITATSFTVHSATSITAIAPAETAARVDVTVTTPGGTSATSKSDLYKFTPAVLALTPDTGTGGTTVTISGAGFAIGTSATAFRFGTTLATSVDCTSTSTCTAVAPAHADGTVDVKATVNKVASPRNRPGDEFTFS